jgi:phosphosulfolactate synthase
MVIDKGLGLHAFEDLMQTAGAYIDVLKLGFGTSALYSSEILRKKAELARAHHICLIPGGTFLEVAVQQGVVPSFFDTVAAAGFTGVEVSDGTIALSRQLRNELIDRGLDHGLHVFTEFGKKLTGSSIDYSELIHTIYEDRHRGAELITMEGRESGMGVGIYNDSGDCKEEEFERMLLHIPNMDWILWEAPLKSQQLFLIQAIGTKVNLGNIPPQEVMSLEALRRGLRSDTFELLHQTCDYMI